MSNENAAVLVAAQTAADSGSVRITGAMVPCTIIAYGLQSAEEVDLYFEALDGSTDLLTDDQGTVQKLTATIHAVAVTSPCLIKASKDATTVAVPVEACW